MVFAKRELFLHNNASHPLLTPKSRCSCCQPRLQGQRESSRRRAQLRTRAAKKGSEEATKSITETDAEAQRIADLERRSRKNRKSVAKQETPAVAPSSSSSGGGGFAEWNEGELLPKGFENMNPVQKAGELWAGKRGALFWANKIAWASLFIAGGAWVLFRVIGPLTGLYTLKNDLLSPPNQ